jgi:hypothetical protein
MSSDDRSGWRLWLPGTVGAIAAATFANVVADKLPLPLSGALAVVVAVVYQLSTSGPRVGPVSALYVAAAGIALTVAIPASWVGPVTVASAVLAVGAALGAYDRVAALTSLAGTGMVAVGALGISESTHMPTASGQVVAICVGSGVALLGLAGIWFRHDVFGARGITIGSLLGIRSAVRTRVSVAGVAAIPFSVQQGQEGHVLIAVLALVAGLPWLVMMIVFGTADRAYVLVGAMLTLSATGIVGLGLVGFYDQEFLGGVVAATVGVALAGGGLSLLRATGTLRPLSER